MANQGGNVCDALFIEAADRGGVIGTAILGCQVLQAIEIAPEADVIQPERSQISVRVMPGSTACTRIGLSGPSSWASPCVRLSRNAFDPL